MSLEYWPHGASSPAGRELADHSLAADLSTTLSQAEAHQAIFDERKWELAYEGKRWFDLVRRPPLVRSNLTFGDSGPS